MATVEEKPCPETLKEEEIKPLVRETIRLPSEGVEAAKTINILNTVLSNEEFLEQLARFFLTTETLVVLERLPRLFKTLELLTREENLRALEKLLELTQAASKAIEQPVKGVGLLGILKATRNPDVRAGLEALLNILKELGQHLVKK